MKILQVIDTLNVGGAEKVFVDICTLLNENQVDVSALFLLNEGVLGKNLTANFPKFCLHRKQKWSITKMKECVVILNKHDIIHCHGRHVYRYIKLVSILFNSKLTIVFQDHNGLVNVNAKVPAFFDTILRPQYYIGVSGILVQWAKNKLNVNTKNCFLLENIIVRDKIYNVIEKEKKYDIILVSNIKKNKNQLFGIQLANKLHKSMLLVGKVQDDTYHALLNAALKKKNTEMIQFDYSINEVQEIVNHASIGLHTSLYETGPLVLIEYLAQGLPFLAYETGEVAKTLKPYFPEYFINNFEIEQWEERINVLLSRKPDFEKMNEVFEKHFGQQHYFNKLMQIYQCIKN